MNIKNAIKESYVFNLLMIIKDLAANSFLFNIQSENNNSTSLSFEYTTWMESSIIYSFMIKIDRKLRKLDKLIYQSIINSNIYIIIKKISMSCKKGFRKFKNPVFENSKLLLYIKKLKSRLNIGKILVGLTVGYIFVNFIIRNISFLSIFSSIWDELLLLILFMYIIIKKIKSSGSLGFNLTPMALPAAIYIILGVAHVMLVAPEIYVAIEGFRAVFQQVLWYFVITQLVRDVTDSKQVINLMISMGLFLGVHATYQYITKVPMPGNWVDVTENISTRAFSIVGSPNILGALFVLFIPMGVGMFLTKKEKNSKRFYLISTVFMVLGLVFTLSRGAWLAFAFSILIYIITLNYKFIVTFILLGGMFILSGGTMSQRLLFMLSPSYMVKSAAGGRLHRWKIGLNVWRQNRILGRGLGRYGGAVAMNNELAPFYLDNYYLKTLTEMGIYGILGLAFVIICFIIFSRNIIKHQDNKNKKILSISLFAGVMGLLAQNFVENIFEVPAMAIYFWIVVALINTLAPKGKSIQTNGKEDLL